MCIATVQLFCSAAFPPLFHSQRPHKGLPGARLPPVLGLPPAPRVPQRRRHRAEGACGLPRHPDPLHRRLPLLPLLYNGPSSRGTLPLPREMGSQQIRRGHFWGARTPSGKKKGQKGKEDVEPLGSATWQRQRSLGAGAGVDRHRGGTSARISEAPGGARALAGARAQACPQAQARAQWQAPAQAQARAQGAGAAAGAGAGAGASAGAGTGTGTHKYIGGQRASQPENPEGRTNPAPSVHPGAPQGAPSEGAPGAHPGTAKAGAARPFKFSNLRISVGAEEEAQTVRGLPLRSPWAAVLAPEGVLRGEGEKGREVGEGEKGGREGRGAFWRVSSLVYRGHVRQASGAAGGGPGNAIRWRTRRSCRRPTGPGQAPRAHLAQPAQLAQQGHWEQLAQGERWAQGVGCSGQGSFLLSSWHQARPPAARLCDAGLLAESGGTGPGTPQLHPQVL